MADKADLYQLVDQLRDQDIYVVRRFIEFILGERDPVWSAFMAAPEDTETLSEADLSAVSDAEAEMSQGRTKPWDQVKKGLDL